MPSPLSRRALAAAAAAVTAAALTLTGGTVASAAPQDAFPGSRPTWAKHAADAGAAAADETVEGEIFFELRHPAAAEALAHAVSTPGSDRYGRPASPAGWIRRFSPEKRDYEAVVSFLKGAGLTITGTPKSRLFVVFRGTAAQMDAAFDAELHRYRYKGKLLAAPSKAPTLPDSVSRGVLGVRLDQASLLTRPSTVTPATAAAAAGLPADLVPATVKTRCSKYYGQRSATLPEAYGATVFPTYLCGYLGTQLRGVYGSKSLSGAGQTVAIVDAYASPTIVQDVNTLARKHGQPTLTTYTQTVAKPFTDVEPCGGRSGWQGEQTLDVVAVHNVAPKARIHYVGASNCGGGIDLAVSHILDERLATIVSNSYGAIGEVPADAVVASQNQQLQAAAEGIGLYYASGDYGDTAALTGVAQPSYFATSPWVTGVGGTTLGIAKNGGIALETGWGTAADAVVTDTGTGATGYASALPGDFVAGAGGGTSTVFDQPDYQAGVVPDAQANGHRVAPDLSADADPFTGQLIGVRTLSDKTGRSGKYEEYGIGGTSLATPLVAAQVALLQQQAGLTYGFINPLIYAASAAAQPVAVFRDVKPVSTGFAFGQPESEVPYLISTNADSSLQTRDGYDEVTGLGSLPIGRATRIATIAGR